MINAVTDQSRERDQLVVIRRCSMKSGRKKCKEAFIAPGILSHREQTFVLDGHFSEWRKGRGERPFPLRPPITIDFF